MYETELVRAVRHDTFGLAVHDRTPDRRLMPSLFALGPDSTVCASAVYFACAPANDRIPGAGTAAKLEHVLARVRALDPRSAAPAVPFAMAHDGDVLPEPAPGVVARRAGRKVHLSGPRASAVAPDAHAAPAHRLGPGRLVSVQAYDSLCSAT